MSHAKTSKRLRFPEQKGDGAETLREEGGCRLRGGTERSEKNESI